MTPAVPVDQSASPAVARFHQALYGHRFETLEQQLQPLLDARDAASEQALLDHLHGHFASAVRQRPDAVQAALAQWHRQCPDSPWPALLQCTYWQEQALAARGTTLASQVGDAQWQRIEVAHSAQWVHALALLQRLPPPWPLAALLTRGVQVFGEPTWLTGWLHEDAHPGDLAELWRHAPPQLQLDPAQLPALPARLPDLLRQAIAAHTPQEGEPPAFFWLLLTLRQCGHGLAALLPYAFLRTPRWGGSHEEILRLADSPLTSRLDEAERNRIRLIAWLDDIDVDSIDTDDGDAIAAALQRGLAALQRPLDDEGRARMHLQLAELYAFADAPGQAAPHYAEAARLSARVALDGSQLMRVLATAIQIGAIHADWLGSFAARGRLGCAHAAVLYGLLCDTGWGGLQRDGAIATQWYRHATTLAPLPAPEQVCPFNDVYYAFSEDMQRRALVGFARSGAELGYPEMQFALGYHHFDYEDSYDPAQAIHWYRLAAAHGFPRASFNLSLIYDRGIDAGGIAGLSPEALARLSNDCELDCLQATAALPELRERDIERANACIRGLRHFLTHHGDEQPRVARILALLEHYGQRGWPEAMRGLGYFHALTANVALQDFDAAVRWCEAACALAPDDADNQALREELRGDGMLSKLRYSRAAARARAHGLPGPQAD